MEQSKVGGELKPGFSGYASSFFALYQRVRLKRKDKKQKEQAQQCLFLLFFGTLQFFLEYKLY